MGASPQPHKPSSGISLSQRTVHWLIPILLTAHNVEEAIAFRTTRATPSSFLPALIDGLASGLTTDVVLMALAVLSLLAFALATIVALRPQSRAALWLLLSLQTAVGINAVAHVAGAVVIFHGYGPGLATALLINAPFTIYVLRRARRESWVSLRAWRLLPVGGLVLHGPVLLGGLWLAAR